MEVAIIAAVVLWLLYVIVSERRNRCRGNCSGCSGCRRGDKSGTYK